MTLKERFENFWYYYKWHTIIAIIILLFAVYGIKMSLSSKQTDMTIVYVSDKYVDASASKNLEKSLKQNKLTKDLNGDKTEYYFLDILFTSFDGKKQDVAVMQKLQMYMVAGSQSLMFVHKYMLEDYDGAFEDIGSLCSNTEKGFCSKNKQIIGISVEGNKYLEGLGINTENLYMCLKQRTNKEIKNKTRDEEYKVAKNIIKFIQSSAE